MPRSTTPPLPETVTDADDGTERPSLADLLVTMAEDGRRARGAAADAPYRRPTATGTGVRMVGCLFRLFLLLVFLAVLAVAAVTMLLNGTF